MMYINTYSLVKRVCVDHTSYILSAVSESHDQIRRGRLGNANKVGMYLSALGRSDCSAGGSVVQPLTDFFLSQERLVSETELLPKVVYHEWWAYDLTEGVRNRSTLRKEKEKKEMALDKETLIAFRDLL